MNLTFRTGISFVRWEGISSSFSSCTPLLLTTSLTLLFIFKESDDRLGSGGEKGVEAEKGAEERENGGNDKPEEREGWEEGVKLAAEVRDGVAEEEIGVANVVLGIDDDSVNWELEDVGGARGVGVGLADVLRPRNPPLEVGVAGELRPGAPPGVNLLRCVEETGSGE